MMGVLVRVVLDGHAGRAPGTGDAARVSKAGVSSAEVDWVDTVIAVGLVVLVALAVVVICGGRVTVSVA